MTLDRRMFLKSAGQSIAGGISLLEYANLCEAVQSVAESVSDNINRSRGNFDARWRFHLGDVSGGESSSLNDSAWTLLDLPHDWSIAGPFCKENPSGAAGAFLPGGIGWYRKTFSVPNSDSDRIIEIDFDGIYMNSDVWINGHHLGHRPYGFVSFGYNLTPYLYYGDRNNILAVRANNSMQPNCRWYSGSGIYRHVWLAKAARLRVDRCGTFVNASKISADNAEIEVRTRIINDQLSNSSVVLVTTIFDADGKIQSTARFHCSVDSGERAVFRQSLSLAKPHLWSTNHPVLYTAVTQLFQAGSVIDTYTTPFGVRTAMFDADRGFLLNGERAVLKGVCIHHDLGSLGAAFHEPAMERRLQLLKQMGCNAIRMSHNPPAPQLLDMCDRMGFLVIDEAFDEWRHPKTPYGYHLYFDKWAEIDLTSMIERDRNHPSIILWSLGNEIPEEREPEGVATARRLVALTHHLDPSRPATCGINSIQVANQNGFAAEFDVVGYNGGGSSTFEYDADHARYPNRRIYGSEAPHTAQTRGVYASDENYCSSYDSCFLRMNSEGAWKHLVERPFVAGAFRWAGVDYLGEPEPHRRFHTVYRETAWPARSGDFGVIDTCGFQKDIYYFYQSQWTAKAMVHILPHWNWDGLEGHSIFVWCYSNCDTVELFLNDRSLGVQHTQTVAGFHLEWQVPFVPGVLRAVGRRDGAVVTIAETRTASAPAQLLLHADPPTLRVNDRNLVHIAATVVDAEGTMVPNASHAIHFDLQGDARIIGVDNGDPLSHMNFQGNTIQAFHGKCIAVVQTTTHPTTINFRAHAEGLKDALLVISPTNP